MEVKVNREIQEYQESIFFGLNLRQLVFSILAIGVAVGVYFGLRNVLGTETVSWLCILGAAPFGAMGFIKYNGMTAEQFAAAFIKSELLMPKYLCFEGENLYYLVLRDCIDGKRASEPPAAKRSARTRRKGEMRHDKGAQPYHKTRQGTNENPQVRATGHSRKARMD